MGTNTTTSYLDPPQLIGRPNADDGLDVLTKVGGFEIGGLAGLMLGAASMHVPIMVDGFISTAAAMIAVSLAPQCREYLIFAHRSKEYGHGLMLNWLGVKPLLDLDMRLGEGTGAALGISMAEAACKILSDEAPVFNSSHLFVFFSVFNPDAVKDVKLYKGVIPAQYGGRISSLLDIFKLL